MTLLGYVFSFIAIAAVAPLIGIVFLSAMPFVRRHKAIAPAFMAVSSALSTVAAVLLFVWVAGLIGIRLTYLMFLIPFFLSMRNDYARIDRARRGTTPVALAAGHSYDPDFQVKMEYGYLVGDIVGLAIPLLFVGTLPFV